MNRGILLILSGYLIWGFFPIYWSLLNHVEPTEILAHRIIWSIPILLLFVGLKSSWRRNVRSVLGDKGELLFLLVTGTLICINWGTYILAVSLGRVIEGSMGYFLSPIFNILGGFIFFKERVSMLQKCAIGFAIVGALYYVASVDVFPWLGLVLALSFASYGLMRKSMKSSAVPGLLLETIVLLPITLFFVFWMVGSTQIAFLTVDRSTDLLLFFAGIVTVVPLVLFTAGARLLPMTTAGILSFVNPTLQFLLGYYYFNEAFNSDQFIGFIGIWLGLLLYCYSLIKKA
ncbi:MAG TPA: EamA family transporter RarD [Candidatus Thioglobus sp.]|jgi:chloramphenicol-sensitive protein RarD|nr:EamA family transporter RarD [Candidatus Thioglobus sp.]HIL21146.1 EamA family transporter RarD [Candidatus Thioglobus sp.]